jgi:hypothetical protein
MNLDLKSGVIKITPKMILRPEMTRNDILEIDVGWQDWNIIDGTPRAFRSIIELPNKGMSPKTILIVYVGINNQPLAFWDLAPWDITAGTQTRPEGRYTKQMRVWFNEMFGVSLPIKRDWGHIDASFDPWNQTAGILCNYRERFSSDEEWAKYKKENKY